jgi:4-hydroxybenzoate polyprenyltransferase
MGTRARSAWWQLLRAGNVFTALSNILAGYLLAGGTWQPAGPLLLLLLASAALYLAGMVLNDVFDLEIDQAERPERPLPSGRIEPRVAKLVGWVLLVDGLTAAGLAAWLLGSWGPLLVALLLAAAIVAYDALLKGTRCAPVAMGACRALNVLLGASGVAAHLGGAWFYAAVLGLYTAGLTLLARNESQQSDAKALHRASTIVQLSLILLLGLPLFTPSLPWGWVVGWLVCLLVVRTQLYPAVVDRGPAAVQQSVSQLIGMFLGLDALAAAAAAGWVAGLLVLALLVPTYIATRRVSMT